MGGNLLYIYGLTFFFFVNSYESYMYLLWKKIRILKSARSDSALSSAQALNIVFKKFGEIVKMLKSLNPPFFVYLTNV
jgi:hypothetical protein